MANFGDLLGTFMQSAMSPSGENRLGNALKNLQANQADSGTSSGPGGSGGLLGSIMDMAKSTLGNASQNPMQAGGLGAVIGSVLGGGSSSISGAVKGGAFAMLASVAYKAYTNMGQQAAADPRANAPAAGDDASADGGLLPVGMRLPETPAEEQALEHKAQLVIRGMINIAKADGQVSSDEVQRIVGKLEENGMGADAQAWILEELRKPLNLDAFVAEIPNQEIAAEVYAASLLAVEVDTPQERQYLEQFAAKTGLHPMVAQHIQNTLGVQV